MRGARELSLINDMKRGCTVRIKLFFFNFIFDQHRPNGENKLKAY